MTTEQAPAVGALLPLSDAHLQDQGLSLITDSEGLEGLYGVDDPTAVSGALVRIDDGDCLEVWTTGYRQPWRLDAIYERVW